LKQRARDVSQHPKAETIDPATLDELRALGPEVLRSVAELFIQDTRARLDELRAHSAGNDLKQLERLAHALKGSCGAVGASRMMHISAELQQRFHEGQSDQTAQLLADLEAEYNEACALLQRELDGV
jgi:HPt (histidine-containing phosphotransfer) domain-containing protein